MGLARASLVCDELRQPARPQEAERLLPAPPANPVLAAQSGGDPSPERGSLAVDPAASAAKGQSTADAPAPAPAAPAADPAARPGPVVPDAPRTARTVAIAVPVEIEVHGRVLVDASIDERDAWKRDLAMGSARLGVEARLAGATTVVEADLASNPMLEDAYVRLDGPAATQLTAGRFKPPFSERRLESTWSLALVDRGLVDHLLVKKNGLGGRRLGAEGSVQPWGGRLDASGGVFLGDRSALETGENAGEDWAARVAVRGWRGLEVGVSGYRAGAAAGGALAHHAAGAFANVHLGPFRAALEGFAGRIAEGPFTAGTALVEWSVRAVASGRLAVTPIAGVEALEVSGATRAAAYGAIAGAVISWTKGLKVKLEGEWARRPGDGAPAIALATQLGTRF